MSIKRALIPTLLLFALAEAGSAATESGTFFSLFASVYTAEDYSKADGVGFRVAFGGAVQLELTAAYYTTFDDSDLELEGGGDLRGVDVELDVIPVDVGVRFKVGEGPIYVALGGSYYLLDADGGNVDDETGFYGNFGVQFSHFFAEAGYREVDGTIDDLVLTDPLLVAPEVDIGLSGFFVNVGWRF
jgi:hypothetical protein